MGWWLKGLGTVSKGTENSQPLEVNLGISQIWVTTQAPGRQGLGIHFHFHSQRGGTAFNFLPGHWLQNLWDF